MISRFSRTVLVAGVSFLSLGVFAAPGFAAPGDSDPLDITADLKFQGITEKNTALEDISDDWTRSGSADLRVKVTYKPYDNTTLYWEGRAIDTGGSLGAQDDSGSISAAEDFLEWRQSWIRFDEVAGLVPLSVQLGRQKFTEPRGLWWVKDIDAARVLYNTTEFNGFLGVSQALASYTTAEDFMEDDQDRLRFLGEGSWLFAPAHRAEARFMYEYDHSGMEDIGSRIRTNDRDTEDLNLVWAGLRLVGEPPAPARLSSIASVGYSLELLGVTGETQTQTSASTADPAFRRVTGANVRDVFGWGLDANLDVTFDAPWRPTVILGYAYGSGDDGEGDDSAFRQTGLHGNSSKLGEASGGMRNYGEVLRPELSNIHVLTAGVGVPVLKASDTTLLYHAYWLADDETGLRSSGISASTNGTDSYLGQGLDLVTNVSLGQEMGLTNTYLRDTKLRVALGGFDSGDAYGPSGDDETAYRGLMELKFRF